MVHAIGLGTVLLVAGSLLSTEPTLRRAALGGAHEAVPPGIRVWTSSDETYRRGERVRVYFRVEREAYVTIFRVDTDGRVRILLPREPWEDNYARGGRTYRVEQPGRSESFLVDDYPGVGYIFGAASSDPFVFDALVRNDHWSLSEVVAEGRIHGDPQVALEETLARLLPEGYTDYDTHLLPYYVEQRYEYPRFLCYDCHAYVSYAYWNPYRYWCNRFSLLIYSDPFYYYPSYWYYGRYGGTRVAFARPARTEPRYVFKTRDRPTGPTITYRERSPERDRRAPADRGVSGADLGGVGSVPAPVGRRLLGGTATNVGAPAARVPMPGRSVREDVVLPEDRRGAAAQPSTVTGQPGRRLLPDAAEPPAASRPSPRYLVPVGPEDTPEQARGRRPAPVERSSPSSERPPVGRESSPPEGRTLARPANPASEGRRPEARPESRPTSRPEARPTPRPEARPAPRPAAPSPRSEPRPAPELRRRPPGEGAGS